VRCNGLQCGTVWCSVVSVVLRQFVSVLTAPYLGCSVLP